jgi:hypothetical protein
VERYKVGLAVFSLNPTIKNNFAGGCAKTARKGERLAAYSLRVKAAESKSRGAAPHADYFLLFRQKGSN